MLAKKQNAIEEEYEDRSTKEVRKFSPFSHLLFL